MVSFAMFSNKTRNRKREKIRKRERGWRQRFGLVKQNGPRPISSLPRNGIVFLSSYR
jgi:hypothetical protein